MGSPTPAHGLANALWWLRFTMRRFGGAQDALAQLLVYGLPLKARPCGGSAGGAVGRWARPSKTAVEGLPSCRFAWNFETTGLTVHFLGPCESAGRERPWDCGPTRIGLLVWHRRWKSEDLLGCYVTSEGRRGLTVVAHSWKRLVGKTKTIVPRNCGWICLVWRHYVSLVFVRVFWCDSKYSRPNQCSFCF